ncbi:endonuclease domain-containing protein [Candidatus Saccharibacteria bacterium]|nr:endonuclease domain-containing protein [Candidatus Saccharibacteria bacterium]
MSQYKQFIFKDYRFVTETKSLELVYGIDDAFEFKETYTFNFDFQPYQQEALDRALQLLFFMAGVSYYKTFLPDEIVIEKGSLDKVTADFLSQTWQNGLGEFFFVNKLDPRRKISFPVNAENVDPVHAELAGKLVGLGGGKDSLVSIELLRGEEDLATWSVGHKKQLSPLVERVGLPHFWVDRQWDRQLLSLNEQGAYNGHVPISAILACVGTVVAVLSGKRDVVVSNEFSANEPTLEYQGVQVNHQYSKSQAFETAFQAVLQSKFGDSLRYYSLLRPLSELRIAELFATSGFETYQDVFSSCNRAFTHDSNHIFWDGTCPKCAFVFLALTPFVPREKIESLFGGKNLLLDPGLDVTYRQLLGIEGGKPLECVGEVRESRQAMRLAQPAYPALDRYQFELPDDYDFRALQAGSMPDEVWQQIENKLR